MWREVEAVANAVAVNLDVFNAVDWQSMLLRIMIIKQGCVNNHDMSMHAMNKRGKIGDGERWNKIIVEYEM